MPDEEGGFYGNDHLTIASIPIDKEGKNMEQLKDIAQPQVIGAFDVLSSKGAKPKDTTIGSSRSSPRRGDLDCLI